MLGLSMLFHLALFSFVLFVSETNSGIRPMRGIVYEVNLVEMPGQGAGKARKPVVKKQGKAQSISKKDIKTRRIKPLKTKKKPLVIAKRTVAKKTRKVKKSKTSPSKLIEKAISRIERQVKTEDKNSHVERAISKLEKETEAGEVGGFGKAGGGLAGGMPMEIYRMEAEGWIKSNWAYPVAMDNAKDFEAVVVVMVKRDGAIMKTRFEKRSANALFDESVSKAIERSDPLPPFPEGYRKRYEEFVINFNLKDLESQ